MEWKLSLLGHFKLHAGRRCDSQSFGQIKEIDFQTVDTFNNDKVGLIVFAGDAFTQLPITSDYVSAKMFLETINPSLITTQGTDIGAAIRLAMKSFTPQEGVGRAIIVITDGENHEGGAVEACQAAQKVFK